MIKMSVEVRGLIPLQNHLNATKKQIGIATQRAILKTAQHVIKAEQEEMRRVFDRPTNFTLNSLTVKFDKPNMRASVEVKDGYWTRSDNYLSVQREGGRRRLKALERNLQHYGVMPEGWIAVPGEGARLDVFGNMSVGQIRQILSWFDAAERVLGSTQNMGEKGRAKKRKGTRRSEAFEYFAALPGHRTGRRSWKNGRSQSLTPGIYKRTFFGHGTAIKPVIIFVRNATYAKRFKFFEVANKTVDKHFAAEFNAAMARSSS